jgi:hypothetical protein
MMVSNHKPCYQCTKRHMGCHSTCPEGLAQDERNRQIREARTPDREFEAYTAEKQRAKDRVQKKLERGGIR